MSAEAHELRFDAQKMRNRPHREEHFFEQPSSQSFLRKFGRNVKAADAHCLLFKNVKRVDRCRAGLERYAACQRARFHEALDQLQRPAVIPMQFIAPVTRLFLEKRLNLTHGGLPQVDNVYVLSYLVRPRHDASIIADSRKPVWKDRSRA